MIDSANPASHLLIAINTPHAITGFDEATWDLVIRQARRTKLLSRIAARAEDLDLSAALPPKAAGILRAARYVASSNRLMITWEINRIRHAVASSGTPVVLLKGAAYVAADLPVARGRIAGDIDILVPAKRLSDVERALQERGWGHIKLREYDQRYYRRWMHELPPLRHADRLTVIDVHHTILPPTSRLTPDANRLWQSARALPALGMFVLGPHDMVLHSVAHLFEDGDLNFAIRDLVDIADLLRHFGDEPGFWEGLIGRAREHQLDRPLFYALRYARALLDTEVPDGVEREIAGSAPPAVVRALMDRAAPKLLLPGHPDRASDVRGMTALLFYMRAHWLRMPPWRLAAHLARKSVMQAVGAWMQWRENQADRSRLGDA